MRPAIAIVLLAAACSSNPTEPDDTIGDDGSSGGAAGTDDESGEPASSSDEGESSSTGGEPWPPACVESSPVVDPTCGVLQLIVGTPNCASLDMTDSADELRAAHTVDCSTDEDGWAVSDVAVEWYRNTTSFTLENAMLMRTDDLPCGGEPTAWLREGAGADGGDEEYPASIRLTWVSTWNDGELAFECSRRENITKTPPIFGEINTMCTDGPMPAPFHYVECCLLSGAPSESSELPTTPCEGGA